MLVVKQSSKTHNERLVGLKEQMLYLVGVLDSISLFEKRLEEIFKKVNGIDAVFGRLDGIIHTELLTRVGTLES